MVDNRCVGEWIIFCGDVEGNDMFVEIFMVFEMEWCVLIVVGVGFVLLVGG